MAGDWIKMRSNLWSDPRVSRICDILDRPKTTVIGALYWLWANADQHSIDGTMPGLTMKGIDRETGIKGFAKALTDPAVNWLIDGADGVSLPRFEEHNGASAKVRAEGQKRKANWRSKSGQPSQALRDKCPTETGTYVPPVTGHIRGKSEAREEKRREELLTPGESEIDTSSREVRLPHHWRPGADLVDFARETQPSWTDEDINHETLQFVDHYASTGERRADWDAAWRKWVRGAKAKAGSKRARVDEKAMDLLLGNVDAQH